jgi:4-hydroxybenzoate polyprenyltransferase
MEVGRDARHGTSYTDPRNAVEAPARKDIPLCVDLDGTLLLTDSLVESILVLIKTNPAYLLLIPWWLVGGKPNLKLQVARRVHMDAGLLPYREELLAFLHKAKHDGRRLILVTAAHRIVAGRIADHLGIFSEVIATDDNTNLKGIRKAEALTGRFGKKGYDYAGNAWIDLHIWRQANEAIVVGASRRLVERVRRTVPVAQVFQRQTRSIMTLLKAIRVHQWAKNALVFIPLLTSHNVTQPRLLLTSFLAFLAFNCWASLAYVVNDLVDLEADRQHPVKKYRPFASGALPLHAAAVLLPVLFLTGLAVALALPLGFASMLGVYLGLTFLYSFYLKRVALVDVISLASLYTIRVYAGSEAIQVQMSDWLLAFSMFVFLSLAAMKRFCELRMMGSSREAAVKGRGYVAGDVNYFFMVGLTTGYIAVLVLALYITSPDIYRLYARPRLLWFVCPLMFYWISRAWILADRNQMPSDPVVFLIKDRHSYVVGLLTLIVMIMAI